MASKEHLINRIESFLPRVLAADRLAARREIKRFIRTKNKSGSKQISEQRFDRLHKRLKASQQKRNRRRENLPPLRFNEDLEEAICLAHDLGHSPFGHSGEVALGRLMKDYAGFDHNKQSLRIVTELEERYPDFPGLNLTWEVRDGILNHSKSGIEIL